MEQYLPTEEFTEVEGRVYNNPQATLDRTNTFIDNWRAAQSMLNQQNTDATRMLGTDVPTVEGGLTGADSYFTSRYQTPQTNSMVADLRATAQAKALNDVLANEQAMWKQRYQNAYRDYQRRAYNRSYGGGGGNTGGNTGGGNTSTWDGEIEDIVSDGNGGLSAVSELTLDNNDIAAGGKYVVEPGSGNIIRIDDTLSIDDPNYQRVYYQQPDGSYATQDKKFVMRNGNILQNNNSNLFQASPILKGNL